ncbi:MAG: lipid-A-disaccharide synthase, partial [Bacteroidales bacterium]|nr:lipid-A-disaccharide synthase [Bacteroidales bacterium]
MGRYFIIAGEASGDLHGSNLIRGLFSADPRAEIRCWGGSLMAEAGGELARDYRDGAVIGFSQVILHPRRFARRLADCKKDILSWEPDAVILIDYPGFNFRIAEFAHKAGFRVFYYIAPKVWASRENRVRKLKEYVDKLFIVFPFEIPYFTSKGVGFVYKGNPLVDAVDGSSAMTESRKDFLDGSGLPDKPIIALLPGSRAGEISSMMPVYMEFADRLHDLPEYSGYQFVIAGAPARSKEDYREYAAGRDHVRVVFGNSYGVMRHAEAAVVNSGTASLECALLGTPQVVAYRTSAFNYLIAKAIIKVRYISLGNLILDRMCFR